MLMAAMDAEVIAFFAALTPLVVIVTTILQSWHQQRIAKAKAAEDKRLADEKAAADKKALEETAARLATKTDQTAQAIAEKVETVHKAVNGEGLAGKLDAVLAWQQAHDAQDNQRFDDMTAQVLLLRAKVDGRPRAGG